MAIQSSLPSGSPMGFIPTQKSNGFGSIIFSKYGLILLVVIVGIVLLWRYNKTYGQISFAAIIILVFGFLIWFQRSGFKVD